MKTTAILLDGGFVTKKLFIRLGRRNPTAQEMIDFSKLAYAKTLQKPPKMCTMNDWHDIGVGNLARDIFLLDVAKT